MKTVGKAGEDWSDMSTSQGMPIAGKPVELGDGTEK